MNRPWWRDGELVTVAGLAVAVLLGTTWFAVTALVQR